MSDEKREKRSFGDYAWALLSLITLSWVSFLILSKKTHDDKWHFFAFLHLAIWFGVFGVIRSDTDPLFAYLLILIAWLVTAAHTLLTAASHPLDGVRKKNDIKLGEMDRDSKLYHKLAHGVPGFENYSKRADPEEQERRNTRILAEKMAERTIPTSGELPEAFYTSDDSPDEMPALSSIAAVTQHKLDVNYCDKYDLRALPGFNSEMVDKVIKARSQKGGFISVDEFIMCAGLKPHFAVKLRPHVICTPRRFNDVSGGKHGRVLDL